MPNTIQRYALVILTALAVLFVDCLAPIGIAAGVLHLFAVLLAVYILDRRGILFTAGLVSFFILLAVPITGMPSDENVWAIYGNRLLSIFSMWCLAVAVIRSPKSEKQAIAKSEVQNEANRESFTSEATPRSDLLFRIALLGISIAILLGLTIWLQLTSLKVSSAHWHTVNEAIATTVAFLVGVTSLVNYYSLRKSIYLFIGVGFFGTAFLDGYHAFVTSEWFSVYMPSAPVSLIPWSWNASRVFLAILMLIGSFAWRNQRVEKQESLEILIYVVVFMLTAMAFGFFAFAPLPHAYYPNSFIGRPSEFVAAGLFLFGLVIYLLRKNWQQDAFEYWVTLSLLIGFITQAVVMSRSHLPFDAMFDFAHALKVVSYLCVEVGLLVGMFRLFVQVDSTAKKLSKTNTQLQQSDTQLRNSLREVNRKNREMQEFVYTVSHDLKSPLVTIQGFLGVLEEDLAAGDTEEVEDSIRRIENATERMHSLIADLLRLSRSGKTLEEVEPVDVAKLLKDVQGEYQSRFEEKKVTLNLPAAVPSVKADRTRLSQVFNNLIGNALKYGCLGEPTSIDVSYEELEGEHHFQIRDHGPGIEPKYHEKVFGLFQRLDNKQEGSGVGLAIASRVVEVHRGRIWVESELGEGTTFHFTLPKDPMAI